MNSPRAEEAGCAQTILSALARRAYRRPVDDEVCRRCWRSTPGRADGGIRRRDRARARAAAREPGIPVPHRARSAAGARRAAPTGSAISSWRRGCRSSSGAAFPTTSCSTSPRAGRLRRAGGARAAGAPDARRSARRGARRRTSPASGCYLRNLAAASPVASLFPDFDDNLRQAFRRETELFFDSIVREDRSVLDLLTRRLHVPQRAAGAPLRHPERLRQPVPARDAADRQPRGGLLGQGSILTVTSHPNRTSPVRPRQVDPREPARHAAAAAAAQRAARSREATAPARCCRCASAWSSTATNPRAPAATR